MPKHNNEKPKVVSLTVQAPTEYLVQILRDSHHLGINGRSLEDVAFEYRRRRANGAL